MQLLAGWLHRGVRGTALAGAGRALPPASGAGAGGPGLLLRAKLPAAVRGMGECGLHLLFFQRKRAQRFILIIVFPRPAIAFLNTLQFSRKCLVKTQGPKHICQRARSACLPDSRISEQVVWGVV